MLSLVLNLACHASGIAALAFAFDMPWWKAALCYFGIFMACWQGAANATSPGFKAVLTGKSPYPNLE